MLEGFGILDFEWFGRVLDDGFWKDFLSDLLEGFWKDFESFFFGGGVGKDLGSKDICSKDICSWVLELGSKDIERIMVHG